MSIVKIGIIGAGGMAANIHLPSLSRISGAKVCAICDLEVKKAEKLAEKYNIPKVYTLYRQMIAENELDAVFVLVQPDQSFRAVLDCLNAGLDVFTEKPAGVTLFQAQTLRRKAKEKNAVLQVGLNRRYIPLLSMIVDRIKSETEINQINSYFIKHEDASMYYNGCSTFFFCDVIHSIDTILWIAGSKPLKAATIQGQYNCSVPNAWNSLILFENGITANLQSNYNAGGRAHGVEIFGETVSAYVDLGFGGAGCSAELIHHKQNMFSMAAAGNSALPNVEKIDGITLAGDENYYVYYGYLAEDEAFIKSVTDRTPPLSGIDESVATIELMDMLLANIL
ncbi:MAG: Gfo/Idh/MocA family oxidoreductase [Oscillospiraceae bacterium]|nr:Gfo/Idh/MocA family oxidoreductase [Oscillospiraceae bacterium]